MVNLNMCPNPLKTPRFWTRNLNAPSLGCGWAWWLSSSMARDSDIRSELSTQSGCCLECSHFFLGSSPLGEAIWKLTDGEATVGESESSSNGCVSHFGSRTSNFNPVFRSKGLSATSWKPQTRTTGWAGPKSLTFQICELIRACCLQCWILGGSSQSNRWLMHFWSKLFWAEGSH